MKPIYVAAYHQSVFGKLMGMSVPEIVAKSLDVNVAELHDCFTLMGATGVAMIGWCAWQLSGKAPKQLQVKDARAAATFNIGGPICASVCTVLTPSA